MTIRDYEKHRLKKRPDAKMVEKLKSIPAAYISDYLKQIGIVNHTVRGARALSPFKSDREHVAGPAITMYFAPVTEAYLYMDAPYMHTEIVEEAQPGDVIVIAGQGAPFGFWGNHTTHQAINQRVAAVVIDGFTRDSRPIIETGFPVFATGVTFESYVRRYDPVAYNIPVSVGGAMVRPGDVLVGDDDGVVVIPIEVFDRVVEGISVISEAEDALEIAVAGRQPWREIYPEIHRRKYLSSNDKKS